MEPMASRAHRLWRGRSRTSSGDASFLPCESQRALFGCRRVSARSRMCLMMVAGERSGDLYGAELATELNRQLGSVELFGCGGDAMRQAGVQTTVDSHQFAMVGITEVVSGLPRAYRAFQALMAEAGRRQPQLAILIDSPSLNLRLAKRLKQCHIPVIYFVSPQIWAWKRWRMRHV